MHRRLMLMSMVCASLHDARAQDEAPGPRHKISAAQLHAGMTTRFPVRMVIGGLLTAQISAPRLLLLPARDQLGATLVVQLTGLQLQPVPPGELDVVFALRYEASDQSIRAHHLDILDLRWSRLQPEILALLKAQLRAASRDAVGEIVLYKFDPRELALPEAMGLEPTQLQVLHDGVLVVFGPKPRR